MSTKYNLSGAYMPAFQKKEVGSVGQRIQLAPLAGQHASKLSDCPWCYHFRSHDVPSFHAHRRFTNHHHFFSTVVSPVRCSFLEASVLILNATQVCFSLNSLCKQCINPTPTVSGTISLPLSSFFQSISLLPIIKKTNLNLQRPSPYPTLL